MKAPNGKIVVSIVGDEDGVLMGLHLLRFDGANATLPMPVEFGADFAAAWAGLRNAASVSGLLDWTRAHLAEAEFGFGSPVAQHAECSGGDPVAGNPRYFGMGYWGVDVGVIEDVAMWSGAETPSRGRTGCTER